METGILPVLREGKRAHVALGFREVGRLVLFLKRL